MDSNKSLDEIIVIEHLLLDAQASLGSVYNARQRRLDFHKLSQRYRFEGKGLLTKTLPRLGKCFDQALAGVHKFNSSVHRFETMKGSELPKLFGELFGRVFQPDGSLLQEPDANCVVWIRLLTYSFYKYELPYSEEQEKQVIQSFIEAEEELTRFAPHLALLQDQLNESSGQRRRRITAEDNLSSALTDDVKLRITREARILLAKLFSSFDGYDISPRHGPGVVSTGERLSAKFHWTNVSHRITDVYPFDAYFCASLGHVCDSYNRFDAVSTTDHPAKVLLVPKDSRGPRLISCEPVDFQWIQQGLRQAIYRLVEHHELTQFNVFFTDQGPNQRGALLGSSSGKYATLDLKEASDRVSLSLVHLLFPSHVNTFLDASRSSSTVLPDGTVLELQKFAPMGSALCFPIMALTIWSLLTAAAPDADTRESILVYGDDVIVPTAFAESAMAVLEAFGLRINRAKSCTQGFFRESCGVDAFEGINVTPVRFRTVWDESPRPDVYTSWIAYANHLYDKRCFSTYNYIVGKLETIYGPIPGEDMKLSCPSLRESPASSSSFKRKVDRDLQKIVYRVRVSESPSVTQERPGWEMLLRFFSESNNPSVPFAEEYREPGFDQLVRPGFAVSQYTKRRSSILKWRWR